MNTTDQALPMTLAQTATVLARHLSDHGLPDPVSLHVTADCQGHCEGSVQLSRPDLPAMATALLAWAATLTAVSFRAWRPPQRPTVHLELHATLTDPAGPVTLLVYGGIEVDPTVLADLEPGHRVPLTLGQLTQWAASTGTGLPA
jgi:hypothetical protein